MRVTLTSLAILLISLGCKTVEPVFELRNAQVPRSVGSAEQVSEAIQRAGFQLGWRITEVRPGRLEGALDVRDHHVIVDIPYSATRYSILYRESLNMLYDDKRKTIHNKYDNWIRNLNKQIRAEWGEMAH